MSGLMNMGLRKQLLENIKPAPRLIQASQRGMRIHVSPCGPVVSKQNGSDLRYRDRTKKPTAATPVEWRRKWSR